MPLDDHKWGEGHTKLADGEMLELNASELTDVTLYNKEEQRALQRMLQIKAGMKPTAMSKRTGHVSHLLVEAEQAELLLQEQKAAARIQKRETRARYGW
jgi:hypothetical protein